MAAEKKARRDRGKEQASPRTRARHRRSGSRGGPHRHGGHDDGGPGIMNLSADELRARGREAVEAARERLAALKPAQKRQAAAVAVLLALAVISLTVSASWTTSTAPAAPATSLRAAADLGGVAPKKRRRRRKHLHEICPHIVKTLGEPYANRYTKTYGTSAEALPSMTTITTGSIPVILGVPHGAGHKDSKYSWQVDNLAPREGASQTFNASSFQSRLSRVSSDTNTQTMAKKISDTFKKRYKRRPYLVQADFHRRFVDANRRVNHSEACCPEMWPKCTAVADYRFTPKGQVDEDFANRVNRGRAIYDEYHGSIVRAMNEIHAKFPGKPIYFIDVHAQRAASDEELDITAEAMEETIIIGTQDGRLVRSREELYGPGGLVGKLQSQGVHVYPPSNEVPDHRLYNGGHGVAEYCFNNTRGGEVNGLQMEFGFRLRMRSKTLEKTAIAIVEALQALL